MKSITTVTMPRGPQRIVCLTEEPTEILYCLGEGDRIVGISAYTVRPSVAREEKPIVSAFIDGSVKKICALKPDLVIGFSDIQAKLAQKLIAANQQVLIFNQRSLSEILEVILSIGALVGRPDEARKLCDGYLRRLEEIGNEAARQSHRPRVYFEEWDEPMITGIQWVSELIELAGGQDVFRNRSTGKLAKERFVTAGEVIEKAPDVVFASWCGKAFDREAFCSREGFGALPAVQANHVHEIPSEIILQPGPACLTDGLDSLVRGIRAAQSGREPGATSNNGPLGHSG